MDITKRGKISLTNTFSKVSQKGKAGVLSTISFFALCLVIIDCTISGGGKWLSFGPLTFRMIMGAVAGICALPQIIKNIKSWVKNPAIISLVIFLVYLIISAVRGYSNGNDISIILSDIKGFSWLALVPVSLSAVNTKERLFFIIKCIIAGAVIQAILVFGVNVYCVFCDKWFETIYHPIIDTQIGSINDITSKMFRIFAKSSPYLIAATVFLAYLQITSNNFKWQIALMSALCLNGLLLTFTRSLYGALAVAVFCVLVSYLLFCIKKYKRALIHVLVSFLFLAIIIAIQFSISGQNYISFAIHRTFKTDIVDTENDKDSEAYTDAESEDVELDNQQSYIEETRESDDIRELTLAELKSSIKNNPIFGNGLGSAVECRDDGYAEYFYYDNINKMGILGLVIYLFPVFYMIYLVIRKWMLKRFDKALLGAVWLSSLAAFLSVSYFNPYMNAVLGISFYSLTISCFILIANEKTTEEEGIDFAI